MQVSGTNDAIFDFVAYSIHDGVKTRALPINKNQIMENAFVSFGYNMVAKQPLMTARRYMPDISTPYSNELVKFAGELIGMYSYKWLMKKPTSFSSMVMKQLLSQGGQYVMRQI